MCVPDKSVHNIYLYVGVYLFVIAVQCLGKAVCCLSVCVWACIENDRIFGGIAMAEFSLPYRGRLGF